MERLFATLSRGESIVEILNYMGLDAMAAGNHDFNYGQKRLKELSEIAKFDIVTSNVITSDGDTFLDPYVIKEMNGIKIGILGLSTPETAYKTNPKNVEGLTFGEPIKYAKETVAKLKSEGVDFIIAVCHLGMDGSTKKEYQSIGVLEAVDGIDLLVDGHSHTALSNGMVVNGATIVQTGEYDKNLGIVDIKVVDGKVTINPRLLSKKEALGQIIEKQIINKVIEKVQINEDYTVKWGDTLSELSVALNIPMSEILAVNSDIINPDLIYAHKLYNIPQEKLIEKEVIQIEKTRVGIVKDPGTT